MGFAKIFSIFSSAGISAGNFLCEAENLVDSLDTTKYLWESVVNWFLTLLSNLVYFICQFVLSLIDLLQVVIYKFLGITTNVGNFQPYDPNNPLIRFLTNDTVITVLRTTTGVAAVLVIVFTIFAIIKGEWDKATKSTEYSIKAVWSRAFRALFGMVIFPAAFMAVVILVNSLLASFSFTLAGSGNASLGGQVFAMCSYDANVYRSYAKNNKRIPIYIDFYDPYADGTVDRYATEELAAIYDAFSTDGTELYNVFATESFSTFANTLSYNPANNSVTNDYKAYGEFEKFVCTAEQYYVMADFIDYAVSNGITYYYKPISDSDIEWKYVDSAIYSNGSLKLTYRDASNLSGGDSYTVVYEASPYSLGSPVQNALGTLSTLLSLDGNYYSMIDYLEGSINKVAWATNKVKLKLSNNYNKFSEVYEQLTGTITRYKLNGDGTYTADASGAYVKLRDNYYVETYKSNGDGTYTADASGNYIKQYYAEWTVQDQILLYEYYRYTYNNAFTNYTINDLENGVELDAYKLECQYYRDYTNSYITLVTYNVVIINGTYYLVEESGEYDAYGDPYFKIVNGDEKRQVLNNFSQYNYQNGKEIGVHIVALDGTGHQFVTNNTMKYDDASGQSYFECAAGDYVFIAGGYVAYDPNNSSHTGLQRYKEGINYIEMANGGYVYIGGYYIKYNSADSTHANLDHYKPDHFVASDTGEYVYYNGEYVLLSDLQATAVNSLPHYSTVEYVENEDGAYVYYNGNYVLYVEGAHDKNATKYAKATYETFEDPKGEYIYYNGKYYLFNSSNADHAEYKRYKPLTFAKDSNGAYVYIESTKEYELYDASNELHADLTDRYEPTDFIEDDMGRYVLYDGDYCLYDSSNANLSKWKRYSPQFMRDDNGDYVLYNKEYVLASSLNIDFSHLQLYAPDHYTQSDYGDYVYIPGYYTPYVASTHGADAIQYKQVNYIESSLGEYVYNSTTGTFVAYDSSTHSGQTRYTKYYVATSDTTNTYVYLEDRFEVYDSSKISHLGKQRFSPSYQVDANGGYVCINNKFVPYEASKHGELTRYSNVQTNAVNINRSNTNITECWYSAVYNMQNEPTECAHLMTNICLADTKGTKFAEVRDEQNIKIRDKYGFVNANGFWQEVDKLVATKNVKEVDWAHKLMGDLKEIYRDLNLEQLITTGEWLTEFNSNVQQIEGEYVASFDTSLISPQGLIFSEIFLGVLKESDGSNLANYMFASKYSEEQKQELVLALCGIEDYETVSTTIDCFVDTFNLLFTPLLEKIMIGQGQDFTEGEVTNVQLYTYKAYLCSLLLSTDSANFFNQIASHLVIMYQFPYDIRITQPDDYTLVINLIKEYLAYKGIDTSVTYSTYSYDLSELESLFKKYLDYDKDGTVEADDITAIYGEAKQSAITLDKTPIKLLENINTQLENVYVSFADIVLREYFNNDIYYGISSDSLKNYGIKLDGENINWGYYGLSINNGKLSYANSNTHTLKQLSNYSELCNVIYATIRAEFDNSNTTCRMVQIYNTVKEDLAKQKVDENSIYWPRYMQIYRAYLCGDSNYITEVVLSNFISTEGVDGRLNEYNTYVKKFEKAIKSLKNVNLVGTYISSMDTAGNITVVLNEAIKWICRNNLYISDFDQDLIKYEHVSTILNFTLIDDLADFINGLLGDIGGRLTGEDLAEYVYEKCGIKDLFETFYDDPSTLGQQLMTLNELIEFSKILSGVEGNELEDIQTSIKNYKKQMQVGEQLQLIVGYAKENNLIADLDTIDGLKDITADGGLVNVSGKYVAQSMINYLQELSIDWTQTMSSHRIVQEYHKHYITYAVRMNSTENAAKTFKFIVNNHTYQTSLTMPTAKLTEYVLGGTYLGYLGFETVYVNQNYTGFFDLDYNGRDYIPRPTGDNATFNSINNFLNQIADKTMKSYYLSNLKNITKSNTDNTNLYDIKVNLSWKNGSTTTTQTKAITNLILGNIIKNKYLDVEILKQITGIDDAKLANINIENVYEDDSGLLTRLKERIGGLTYDNVMKNINTVETIAPTINLSTFKNNLYYSAASVYALTELSEDANDALYAADTFNSVIGYLTGAVKDYASMTNKQFRRELMQAIIDYQPDSASTAEQNQKRFLTLFYVFCSDFVKQPAADGVTSVYYALDTTTKGLVMELAGVKDQPDEMLVGLEYTDLDDYFEGYDENNGDYFIVCTFDEETQMYIPFMMNSGTSNSAYKKVDGIVNGEPGQVSWLDLGYGVARSDYYYGSNTAYPVIAKGIITEDGLPTAIRQANGVTEFYRDNLVIRNASELNLQAYYMSTENLSVGYNFFSLITNSISKVLTGKSLVEHAYSNIPRFSIDSNIDLPIGVDNEVITLTSSSISANYSFTNLSGLSLQHFYKTLDINFLMMIVAIIALFPLIIKALYGVFGRIVDITVYYCMSPVMMSTIALGKNADKGKEVTPIYTEWMKKLTQKTISVFGYVFGFQVFFILVPFLAKIEFISAAEFETMQTLNTMMPFLADWGYIVINRFINLVFVICSAYLITEAPNIISDILGQSNGFKEGETLKGNIKSTVSEVKETLNGTKAVNAINYAKESLKENLGINAVRDVAGRVKKAGAKAAAKGAEWYMRAHGVDKQTAKKLTKQMADNVAKEVDNKKALRDERKYQAYDAYHQQIGMGGDTHTKQLQKIDQKLYDAGLRKRTAKEQKAIQNAYNKRIEEEKTAKEKAKKEKSKGKK